MSVITPGTEIGTVTLRVANLERAHQFYAESLGLTEIESDSDSLAMGAPGDARPLVRLLSTPEAPARPPRTSGLFHLAILVPNRLELARSLNRVLAAGWRLGGASDHLVSEALYLDDPEGNGIEIYRDRQRSEWRRSASGEVEMATLPLDLRGLMAEFDRQGAEGTARVPAGTKIGHVHLNVSDLDAAERFYSDELGFDVMVRGYPGALFVAADGYHHHLGLNTWNGVGAPPPPEGSLGLDHFEVLVPGLESPRRLTDPAGNSVQLIAV